MGKTVQKLTDKQFLAILRENGGLYARTARAIEEKYGTTFTRQAVRQRAEKHPEELKDIEEEIIDVAEEGLQTLIRKGEDRTKLRAIEIYLKTKGRTRGYIESSHIDHTSKGEQIVQNIINLGPGEKPKD